MVPVTEKRIAVTLGDPRGIGPEVMPQAVEALSGEIPSDRLFILGPEGLDPGLAPYQSVGTWDGSEAGAGRVTAAAIDMMCRNWARRMQPGWEIRLINWQKGSESRLCFFAITFSAQTVS